MPAQREAPHPVRPFLSNDRTLLPGAAREGRAGQCRPVPMREFPMSSEWLPQQTATAGGDPAGTPRQELTFRIEFWDAAKSRIELVLAEVARGSIAYAVYNAAMRE